MLDKLINDLKSKFNAKKKGGETESEDEESDELHADHEEDQDSESDTLEAVPKDDGKKKNSLVIKIVIVLAIGYLAYDYLMPKEDEVSIDQMVQNAPKPKRKKPKREEVASAETTNTDTPSAENVANADSSTAPSEDVASGENVASTTTAPSSETPTSEPDLSNAPIENINVSSAVNPDSSTGSTTDLSTSPPNLESTPASAPAVGEAAIEDVKVSELPMSGMGEGSSSISSSETNEPMSSTPKETSLTSKVETVSEYVPPPKYEILGRGLIYNCKGKHWACVDKENYQVCFKNMKWNSDNGKASECVTQNVYANEDDCGKVQRYNVSTNVETSFCKN